MHIKEKADKIFCLKEMILLHTRSIALSLVLGGSLWLFWWVGCGKVTPQDFRFWRFAQKSDRASTWHSCTSPRSPCPEPRSLSSSGSPCEARRLFSNLKVTSVHAFPPGRVTLWGTVQGTAWPERPPWPPPSIPGRRWLWASPGPGRPAVSFMPTMKCSQVTWLARIPPCFSF